MSATALDLVMYEVHLDMPVEMYDRVVETATARGLNPSSMYLYLLRAFVDASNDGPVRLPSTTYLRDETATISVVLPRETYRALAPVSRALNLTVQQLLGAVVPWWIRRVQDYEVS